MPYSISVGWLNTGTPTAEVNPRVEQVSLTPASQTAYRAIFDAGERLLAALDQEHRSLKRYPKDITEVVEYLERVSALRRRVRDCATEYCERLTACGFPKADADEVIERGRNQGAAGLAMLFPRNELAR